MNGKWDSHHPHSCSAASAVRYVVIAATLLLKARGWFCVNVIQCWESSVPMLSSANHPGMCYAVLSTQRSVLECKVVTDSPALERKNASFKKYWSLAHMPPFLYRFLYEALTHSIWNHTASFFLDSLVSKPNTNQQTSKKKHFCVAILWQVGLCLLFYFFLIKTRPSSFSLSKIKAVVTKDKMCPWEKIKKK